MASLAPVQFVPRLDVADTPPSTSPHWRVPDTTPVVSIPWNDTNDEVNEFLDRPLRLATTLSVYIHAEPVRVVFITKAERLKTEIVSAVTSGL